MRFLYAWKNQVLYKTVGTIKYIVANNYADNTQISNRNRLLSASHYQPQKAKIQ